MRIDVTEAGTPAAELWADEWFDRWYAALDAGDRHGRPDPVPYHAADLRAGLSRTIESERRFVLSAVDGEGDVVAAGRVFLPQLDNKELAQVEVFVAPERRRRGHGTALLRAAADLAVTHGRTTFYTDLARPFDQPQASWPGSAFVMARGFAFGCDNVRRDLPLPSDAALLAGLREQALAASAGYVLRTWKGRAPVKDRSRMAALMARMSTDAPLGDLDYEPEAWDAARVAEFEDYNAALGRQWWVAVVVAPDGEWVGYTQLGRSPHEPERLDQWDTLVVRKHRGHRLGLLLKVAALAEAERDWPDARVVSTWNAASNEPMIAVNEAMGFRPVEADEEWQGRFDDLVGV